MMQPGKLFYIKLYLFWLLWVSARAVLIASLLSLLFAVTLYIAKGSVPLNAESLSALKALVGLAFPIAFSLGLIIALFWVFKAFFAYRIEGFGFELYDCRQEKIEEILLSDVSLLWRRWLFVTVWTILLFLVFFLGVFRLLVGAFPPLSWFNGYTLYLLIMLFGGGSFLFTVRRCKKVGIVDV